MSELRACSDVDPEVFFGPADSSEDSEPFGWEHEALGVCGSCGAVAGCLSEALKYPAPQQYGVVGGLRAAERRQILASGDVAGAVARAEAAVARARSTRRAGAEEAGRTGRVTRWAADKSEAAVTGAELGAGGAR